MKIQFLPEITGDHNCSTNFNIKYPNIKYPCRKSNQPTNQVVYYVGVTNEITVSDKIWLCHSRGIFAKIKEGQFIKVLGKLTNT